MGLEATCTARFGTHTSEGKLRLEEKELTFRGAAVRLRLSLARVRSAEANKGELRVEAPEGLITFALGPAAEKWALKIRSPRGLIEKLGVKPGARVAVLGIEDASFVEQLRERTTDISEGEVRKDTDLIFVAMEQKSDLRKLKALRTAIKPDGAIWVVWPKGHKAFREDDVRAAGVQVGLVDVKVVSFSDTLSALKMVIPLKLRPRRA
jgi:hypothetical protein